MAKKNYIPDHLKDKEYFAGKAGSFSGVPLRTVQTWTEKGLLIPGKSGTTGTGDKRIYSSLNCIEIAIVKFLANKRMKLNEIKNIMDWLRKPCGAVEDEILRHLRQDPSPGLNTFEYRKALHGESLLEALLLEDPGYLIISESGDNVIFLTVSKGLMKKCGSNKLGELEIWHYFTSAKTWRPKRKPHDTTADFESVMIINLSKIADAVLKKMG